MTDPAVRRGSRAESGQIDGSVGVVSNGPHPSVLRVRRQDAEARVSNDGLEPLKTKDSVGRGEAELQAEKNKQHDFAESVIDTAPVIVLVLDLDGRIVRFNPFMQRLCGYRLDELKGADWFTTFIPERDRLKIQGVFAESIAGVRVRGKQNPIVIRDGTERLIEWYDTQLDDADGKLVGLLAIGRDITEEKRLEEENLQARKMEAVGTLSAGIAHDFNNLLMSIIGMADMSLTQLSPQHPARRYIEELRSAAGGGAAIVGQLMRFSRKGAVEPRDTQIDAVIERSALMLRALLGRHVTLRLELGASGGYASLALGQLEQILMNLCANARHAMPSGGTLTIRSVCVTLGEGGQACVPGLFPGHYVELCVDDTGFGMDKATCARIFEPFFTTKAEGYGTGLGLSAVYGIVRHSDGHIEVHSESGVGTTVRILLPRVHPSVVGMDALTRTADHGRAETVLVIEGDALVRTTIRHYLGRGGYRVFDAADAAEAIELAREHGDGIDLVLSDTVLSDIQGAELVKRLVEMLPRARAVFMSAHPRERLVHEGRIEHGRTVLEKPFTEQELWAALNLAIKRGGPSGPHPRAAGASVLLVEDYEVARSAMRELLEDAGLSVLAVASAAEALAWVDAHPAGIDLLLTDVELADGSGLELADQLRTRAPDLRLVFISGRVGDPAIDAVVKRHDAVCLTKPVDVEKIVRVVERELTRQR